MPAGHRGEPNPSAETPTGPIAVVEDDATTRRVMCGWLERAGYSTIELPDATSALAALPGNCSLVCLDLGLDDAPGLHVLPHLRARDPDLPILVITGDRRVDTAVTAMRAGAQDYLVKPVDQARLLDSVRVALERRALIDRVRHRARGDEGPKLGGSIVGRSAAMRELARQVDRVVESDISVCILGESGTGKELVARAIHAVGRRKRGPFVAINCASIPESLQESELFGHERGAFTGAAGMRRGRFEEADGGTLFLDEIGEMSASTQASLLRALQERSIRRVGGTVDIHVDLRILCATHRDLAREVELGRFREDLYFRLVVYPIQVPPLRSRTDDIPLLVGHFLDQLGPDVGRKVHRVSADALAAMARYRWPGNVRELQNVVHRAMLGCEGDEIRLNDLPAEIRSGMLPEMPQPTETVTENGEIVPLEELERRAIAHAMEVSGGSVGKAARLLGVGRATLYRRLATSGPGPGKGSPPS